MMEAVVGRENMWLDELLPLQIRQADKHMQTSLRGIAKRAKVSPKHLNFLHYVPLN